MRRSVPVLAVLALVGSCAAAAAAYDAGRRTTRVAPAARTAAPQPARSLASHPLGFAPTVAVPAVAGGYALELGLVGGTVVRPLTLTRLSARIGYFGGSATPSRPVSRAAARIA